MMGRQSGQLSMMVMDLSELIPNNPFVEKNLTSHFIRLYL